MRIIAGKYRGKKLNSLDGIDTRPTLDRVKENVFNSIQNKIYDAKVLDLFSGSGALGIECLSRGASYVIFNDKNPKAIEVINENLTNIDGRYDIFCQEWTDTIKNLLQNDQKFDIIFLDAPYKNDYLMHCVEYCISLLYDDGIIVIEHDESYTFENSLKCKKYGKVYVSFIGK